jgi:two-component system, chemotaxis family, sensor kinase CheA
MSVPPIFFEEARELLAAMQQGLLERASAPADAINAIFRAAHTLKGAAGIFGLDAIVHFAHAAEAVLDAVRDGRLALTDAVSGQLLEAHDELERLIEGVAAGHTLEGRAGLAEGLLATARGQPTAVVSQAAPSRAPANRYDVRVRFGESVMREGFDPISFIGFLGTLGELSAVTADLSRLPDHDFDPTNCGLTVTATLVSTVSADTVRSTFEFILDSSEVVVTPVAALTPAPAPVNVSEVKAMTAGAARVDGPRQVKVPAERLDALIDLVGELVSAGATAQAAAARAKDGATVEALAALSELVASIRDTSLALRMVPIGDTFTRFHRVVRDLAKQLQKQITLELHGADTELDKAMVDRLVDPLTHLVRNSLDHGLETPEVRVAAGKGPMGTLRLSAAHEAGAVVIDISDDGRGLDRERIRQKAIARGLVSADAALSVAELDQLIFLPGFSSVDTVSELSGRGVGMDVVKKTVEALRGTIELSSTAGQGTRLRLRLPLTLAIIDGFQVTAGDGTWVVPLKAIHECLDFSQVVESEAHHLLAVRGEAVPFIRLRELFRLRGDRPSREAVVVVQHGERRVALVVDALRGAAQTVIKPLGPVFRHMEGIGGATLLGSGEVGFIIDVGQVVALAMADRRRMVRAA